MLDKISSADDELWFLEHVALNIKLALLLAINVSVWQTGHTMVHYRSK